MIIQITNENLTELGRAVELDRGQKLVRFDRREEFADAFELAFKDYRGQKIRMTYLPAKSVEENAKIDIFSHQGYVGYVLA